MNRGTAIICCRHCREPIEGCIGIHGNWMHQGSRSEACAEGFAEPETPEQFQTRINGREQAA